MLKVAIVGCGKVADDHVLQIQRIPGCSIVGVCDRERLMARQLCERFYIAEYFDDVTEMLVRTLTGQDLIADDQCTERDGVRAQAGSVSSANFSLSCVSTLLTCLPMRRPSSS